MNQEVESVNDNQLHTRVKKIRFGIVMIEILILVFYIIGILTRLWKPSGGTILFLLVCMTIPLIFLSNPEHHHLD